MVSSSSSPPSRSSSPFRRRPRPSNIHTADAILQQAQEALQRIDPNNEHVVVTSPVVIGKSSSSPTNNDNEDDESLVESILAKQDWFCCPTGGRRRRTATTTSPADVTVTSSPARTPTRPTTGTLATGRFQVEEDDQVQVLHEMNDDDDSDDSNSSEPLLNQLPPVTAKNTTTVPPTNRSIISTSSLSAVLDTPVSPLSVEANNNTALAQQLSVQQNKVLEHEEMIRQLKFELQLLQEERRLRDESLNISAVPESIREDGGSMNVSDPPDVLSGVFSVAEESSSEGNHVPATDVYSVAEESSESEREILSPEPTPLEPPVPPPEQQMEVFAVAKESEEEQKSPLDAYSVAEESSESEQIQEHEEQPIDQQQQQPDESYSVAEESSEVELETIHEHEQQDEDDTTRAETPVRSNSRVIFYERDSNDDNADEPYLTPPRLSQQQESSPLPPFSLEETLARAESPLLLERKRRRLSITTDWTRPAVEEQEHIECEAMSHLAECEPRGHFSNSAVNITSVLLVLLSFFLCHTSWLSRAYWCAPIRPGTVLYPGLDRSVVLHADVWWKKSNSMIANSTEQFIKRSLLGCHTPRWSNLIWKNNRLTFFDERTKNFKNYDAPGGAELQADKVVLYGKHEKKVLHEPW